MNTEPGLPTAPRTRAEVWAQHPEHQRVHEADAKLKAGAQLMRYLVNQGIVLAYETTADDDAEDDDGGERTELTRAHHMYASSANDRLDQHHLFAAFGLNYAAFMAEKEAMLDTLAAAQAAHDPS